MTMCPPVRVIYATDNLLADCPRDTVAIAGRGYEYADIRLSVRVSMAVDCHGTGTLHADIIGIVGDTERRTELNGAAAARVLEAMHHLDMAPHAYWFDRLLDACEEL